MKVLLTGSTGQLGRALLRSIPAGITTIPLDRAACDLAVPATLRAAVEAHLPDVVINTAAYTQVDKAETEHELAFQVNAEAPRILAQAIADAGGRLIQLSTDFVFDGTQGTPYLPDAATAPLNVYGASKLAGEQAALEALGLAATVIRTAWVYSSQGSNFVKTMLRLMASRETVNVVSDQIGGPTSARSLARAVWATVENRVNGILHWTDAGVASWYDFAVAIEEEARARRLIPHHVEVVPISSAEYSRQFPAAVRRPAFSVLDTRSSREALGIGATHWRTCLREMLDELAA